MQNAPGVERQLDALIERLTSAANEPAARALLIEARRLRSGIENWRSVAPAPGVREEMMARVLHLSGTVSDMLAPASRNVPQAPHSYGRSPSSGAMRAVTLGGGGIEETVITEGSSALPSTPLDVHHVSISEDPSPHLAMIRDPYSSKADAYRALRHRLTGRGDPKIVGVTSPVRREGKTTTAINLAASLREGARGRVLLVEANLRAPGVAAMLGFMPPVCFNEQLIRHKKSPLEPWDAAEVLPQLHVLAINPVNKYPPLIDPIAFSIAIDRLSLAGYDYIVVDAPPVLESADVNLIADSVDGFILTALARKTESRSIKRAIAQLGQAAFLGSVLLE